MSVARLSWAFLVDSVPFTKAVVAGETSLGGSESACLGLARALAKRGHDVHLFTTQLAADAVGPDHAGVVWHPLDEFQTLNSFIEWDVVCALRMMQTFAAHPVFARLRILWSQDLLVPGQMQSTVMAIAWAMDHIAYVSAYHRAQWEALQPELTALGWVTKNGFDPAHLPTAPVYRNPNRIIHISRPERGLGPLLAMWPKLKALEPAAELQICRYSSMYDQGPGSWSDVCASFDARVKQLNDEVGGITYLGELNKPQLYQAISEAAVMWYPGVASFAETSCIAAIEAQACGTPFVGSYRGGLPETVPGGVLIPGDAEKDDTYQTASIEAVRKLMAACRTQAFDYRRLQKDGRRHVEAYTYAGLAEQWETQVETWFAERYQANRPRILRQLLHEDDHVAAKIVAGELDDAKTVAWCDYVIAGKDHTAEQYGNAAIADPLIEAEASDRFRVVVPHFEKAAHVLDVACGNGSFAIALCKANPTVHVHGLDYSTANIERAKEGAERAGVADRCVFQRVTVYDFDEQRIDDEMLGWMHLVGHLVGEDQPAYFDGLFVGEFIEHVANYRDMIDGLEAVLAVGATVVYTCPHGACAELVPRHVPLHRGHVHRFHHDDLKTVFGPKQGFVADYLSGGYTERGVPIGNWIIRYQVNPLKRTGERPIASRIQRTRPMQTITVGMIVKDAENDLGRCLSSVYSNADEILIGDTGSMDATKAIAKSYGAKVLDLPSVMEHQDGFAGVRNEVLKAAKGDWFLWIDADEQLIHSYYLRRYLDGLTYNGFVLRQTHVYIDGPPTQDIPVRIFRNTGRVQFYGCVHEQPQDGEANADIYPTLDVGDVIVAHHGYLTQEGREEKRVSRNLPLLLRDQQRFADRLLGKVLLLREAVIQADMMRASRGGQITPKAQQGYVHAVKLFVEHFDDPTHKFHKIARPWYEAALQHLGLGWEMEITTAGRRGGMQGVAKPERVWVRDAPEYLRLVAFKAESLAKAMQPVTFVTDPDVLRPPVSQPAREAVSA